MNDENVTEDPGQISDDDLPRSKSLASKMNSLNPLYWEKQRDALTNLLAKVSMAVGAITNSDAGASLNEQMANATSDTERLRIQDQLHSLSRVEDFKKTSSETVEKVYNRESVSGEDATALVDALKELTKDLKKLESVSSIRSEDLRSEQISTVGDSRISTGARTDAMAGLVKDVTLNSPTAISASPEMKALYQEIGIDISASIEDRIKQLDDPRYMKQLGKKLKSNKRTDVIYDLLLNLGKREKSVQGLSSKIGTTLKSAQDPEAKTADIEYLVKDLVTSMSGLPDYMKETSELTTLLDQSKDSGDLNQKKLTEMLDKMSVDTTPERSLRSLEEINEQMDDLVMNSDEMLEAMEEDNLANKFKDNASKMAEGAKGPLKTLLGGLLGAIAPGLGDLVDVGDMFDSVFRGRNRGAGPDGKRTGKTGAKPGILKRTGGAIKGGLGRLKDKILPGASAAASAGAAIGDGVGSDVGRNNRTTTAPDGPDGKKSKPPASHPDGHRSPAQRTAKKGRGKLSKILTLGGTLFGGAAVASSAGAFDGVGSNQDPVVPDVPTPESPTKTAPAKASKPVPQHVLEPKQAPAPSAPELPASEVSRNSKVNPETGKKYNKAEKKALKKARTAERVQKNEQRALEAERSTKSPEPSKSSVASGGSRAEDKPKHSSERVKATSSPSGPSPEISPDSPKISNDAQKTVSSKSTSSEVDSKSSHSSDNSTKRSTSVDERSKSSTSTDLSENSSDSKKASAKRSDISISDASSETSSVQSESAKKVRNDETSKRSTSSEDHSKSSTSSSDTSSSDRKSSTSSENSSSSENSRKASAQRSEISTTETKTGTTVQSESVKRVPDGKSPVEVASRSGKIAGEASTKAIGQAVDAGEDVALKSGKMASKGKSLVSSVKKIPGSGAVKALGTVAGKLALPLAVLTTALDAKDGWDNAGEILGKAEGDLTAGDKAYAATLSGISGLTLGIADPKTIDSGFKAIGKFLGFVDDNAESPSTLSPEEQIQKKAEMEAIAQAAVKSAAGGATILQSQTVVQGPAQSNGTVGVMAPVSASPAASPGGSSGQANKSEPTTSVAPVVSATPVKQETPKAPVVRATAAPTNTAVEKAAASTSQIYNSKVTSSQQQATSISQQTPKEVKSNVPAFLRPPPAQPAKQTGGSRAPLSFNDPDTTLASGAHI